MTRRIPAAAIIGLVASGSLIALAVLEAQPRDVVRYRTQILHQTAHPGHQGEAPAPIIVTEPFTQRVAPSTRELVTLTIVGGMALLFAAYFVSLLVGLWRFTARAPGKEPPKYLLDHLNRASSAALGLVVGFVLGTNVPADAQAPPVSAPAAGPAASGLSPAPRDLPAAGGDVAPSRPPATR